MGQQWLTRPQIPLARYTEKRVSHDFAANLRFIRAPHCFALSQYSVKKQYRESRFTTIN